jgi:hypothetical protein
MEALAMSKAFKVGDTVQASKKYLHNTGQYSGPETQKVWSVLSVRGNFVTVSEDFGDPSYFTEDEREKEPLLHFRQMSAAALSKTKKLKNCYSVLCWALEDRILNGAWPL